MKQDFSFVELEVFFFDILRGFTITVHSESKIQLKCRCQSDDHLKDG
jgi:hypothetical protein